MRESINNFHTYFFLDYNFNHFFFWWSIDWHWWLLLHNSSSIASCYLNHIISVHQFQVNKLIYAFLFLTDESREFFSTASSRPFRYGNFRFIIHLLYPPYRGHKINNIKTDVERKCGSCSVCIANKEICWVWSALWWFQGMEFNIFKSLNFLKKSHHSLDILYNTCKMRSAANQKSIS